MTTTPTSPSRTALVPAPIPASTSALEVMSAENLKQLLVANGVPDDDNLNQMCSWLTERLRRPESHRVPTVLAASNIRRLSFSHDLPRLLAKYLWVSADGCSQRVRCLRVTWKRKYQPPALEPGQPVVVMMNRPEWVDPTLVKDLPRWSMMDQNPLYPGRQVLVVISAKAVDQECLAIMQECHWLGSLGKRRCPHHLRHMVRERIPLFRDLLGRHAHVYFQGLDAWGLAGDESLPSITDHMLMCYVSDLVHPEIPGLGPVPSIQHLLGHIQKLFGKNKAGLLDALAGIMSTSDSGDVRGVAAELLVLLA